MKRFYLLFATLAVLSACNKKDPDNATAWKIGDATYSGLSTMRADNALIVKSPASRSFIYAGFAELPTVNGKYRVVGTTPAAPDEISLSVSRDGENYISSGSGNTIARVSINKKKLNISVSRVWMLHLPDRQDSLLLDAVMIEQ